MKRLLAGLALAGLAWQAPADKPKAEDVLEYAALRDGRALYWRVADAAGAAAGALPPGLETPLGSVWKLFVHAYLVDRGENPPDYVCGGRDPEEVYCCAPGGSVGRDAALVQSCGLYFRPARLGLKTADWSLYWRARRAPAWLTRLDAMAPATRVPVAELLRALDSVPAAARRQSGGTLLAGVLAARDPDVVRRFGGLLRVKSYSWHQPGQPSRRIGGAAGWLADGSPVWLRGQGTSLTVLPRAAARLPDGLAQPDGPTQPEDGGAGCVTVDMFARHPLAAVTDAEGRPARPGPLRGRHSARFANGNRLELDSGGELRLLPGAPLRLVARLTVNEYVARVLEREAAAEPEAASRALAVAARSYLVQEARREGECLAIADSSALQRVLASPASAPARRVAAWTDSLVLTGAPVHYHLDQPGPNRLAWQQAVAWARAGAAFDEILLRVWPDASLASTDSPLANDCPRLPEAERWLASQASRWRPRLAREDGFEPPPPPAVCRLARGNPYADPARGRIYAHGPGSQEARLTLAHEYLHLAFARHPHGGDEAYIEDLARRLLLGGSP